MIMEYQYSMRALASAIASANRRSDNDGKTYLIVRQAIGGYRGDELAYYGPMTEQEQEEKFPHGIVLYTATPANTDDSFVVLNRYRIIARLFEEEWHDAWQSYHP
jgi:hypothetical protein